MASTLGSSNWYRYLLAPAMLAILIGGPVASIAASEYGLSWWAVFLAASGGLALFWDLAMHREEDSHRPLETREDPVFGRLMCYEPGIWQAQERVQMEGAWLPVAVEAGSEGPSSAQQDTYREFLRDPSAVRAELVKSLIGVAGQATHPGMVPVGMFLPKHEDPAAPSMEIEVMVDGDETGPHEEVVGFRAGRALSVRHLPETRPGRVA
ncbi:MAG: hypothetical protein H6830_01105 [Planctomycetes bacterium]|nr:hypothetical protein [Planctomycetota bacterium]MCB9911121.1 hypothetical protein [Planctomycetota bacterium]MCB9912146.1 hypothetical protein [Planctomycetota bacterium]HPF12826.1 hypothetical protein [Planctomycetota bacterium]